MRAHALATLATPWLKRRQGAAIPAFYASIIIKYFQKSNTWIATPLTRLAMTEVDILRFLISKYPSPAILFCSLATSPTVGEVNYKLFTISSTSSASLSFLLFSPFYSLSQLLSVLAPHSSHQQGVDEKERRNFQKGNPIYIIVH